MLTTCKNSHIYSTKQEKYVQFGCGLCAPESWLNFDSSPALRLQKLPVVGNLVPSGPFGRFPKNVQYGDIVVGLPVPENSIALLYSSHVLEHLTLMELRQALKNCYRILKLGGIFRFVLPDLEFMAHQYINSVNSDAAVEFMQLTWLGIQERRNGLLGFLKEYLGGSKHLWMWDYKSLSLELEKVGFKNIRRAYFGDSNFSNFTQVEYLERWENELGIECNK
ncbi:methyltransferase domain-containing protein [Mastigocoleus sp. MO_188.B34]|uniref:class I SAM-dependent methyltransferase n=1 Tax=Mastigocoleus sp. MO_188.B34 TaxID=3036635 RepID=UPI002610195B|nr:methyltransferase domain-containing protein [Mastigocoleus sp. MO_188.B34]MDJ0696295.1 methyltransferase domain-containing protein [Mastigocoleus sp. MO_188.B34]